MATYIKRSIYRTGS